MEKKKHRFFWEDDGKDTSTGNSHPNSFRIHSRPTITHMERKPLAFGFSFRFPMPAMSRSDISIKESEKEIIVTAMFPGFSKEDISVDINQKYIKLRAEKKKSAKRHSDSASFSMEEMSCIERTASLPTEVEPRHAKIDFAHGIMTITLPRSKKKKFSLFGKQ